MERYGRQLSASSAGRPARPRSWSRWPVGSASTPRESSDAALQKRLLVLMSVGILPMTILWSVTYFAAGAPLAAAAPAVYSVVTPINTGGLRVSASLGARADQA